MRAAHAFTQKFSPQAEKRLFSPGNGDYADYQPFDLKSLQAIVGNDRWRPRCRCHNQWWKR